MYYTNNEDYLAHHGILGQKWGIRRYQNPDGTLTDEGRKRLGYTISKYLTAKSRQKSFYGISKAGEKKYAAEIDDSVKRTDSFNKAKESLSDYREAMKGIDKQKASVMKDYKSRDYINETAIMAIMSVDNTDNPTLKRINDALYSYREEDGNQGDYSTYAAYLYKNPKVYNDVQKVLSNEKNIKDQYINNIRKNIEEEFGDTGLKQLPQVDKRYAYGAKNVNEYITEQILRKSGDYSTYYDLYPEDKYTASKALDFDYATDSYNRWNDTNKSYYDKAEQISKIITTNMPNENNWQFLDLAIDKLDLENVRVNDISDATWKEINSECIRLKELGSQRYD